MAQVETLKIGNTSYGITDANTLPALTAEQRSQLLLDGTYLGSAVDSGKVFETVNGTFEQFTKTAEAPATYALTELNQSLKNTATNSNSLTIGGTAATQDHSTNVGINSRAGFASTSVGRNANASGAGGVALGASTTASGINTAAVGYNAQATAGGALMLGYGNNNEEKTFKVALTNTATKATDESTGLFTVLKADGKMPVERLGGSASSTNNKFLKEDGTWNEINAATINDDAISSVTQTWSANKIVTVFHSYASSKQDLLTDLPGYDATATQSIKNINGVLQWVTDSTT